MLASDASEKAVTSPNDDYDDNEEEDDVRNSHLLRITCILCTVLGI